VYANDGIALHFLLRSCGDGVVSAMAAPQLKGTGVPAGVRVLRGLLARGRPSLT
jgi:hypothetical protein